jgi:hypothetical protein
MNPYLEQSDVWEDFHSGFIVHARDVLNAQVGEHYLVKVEERLYIHELSEGERHFLGRGDIGITAKSDDRPGSPGIGTLEAPLHLSLPAVDIHRERYLEVHDRRDRRLVTVLEMLSPSNKTPGPDHDAYLGKRRSLLATMTNFVEIDLRRGGVRPTPPELPSCDYYALVSRYPDRPSDVATWPLRFRERLPQLPIPLSGDDPPVFLDLQAVLHHVYDAAGYAKYIYQEAPTPPLAPDDAAWAQQFLPKTP